MQVVIPQTEAILLQQAWSVSGLTLGELAEKLNLKVPHNLNGHKGWIGELLETALGATAGSLPEPDFQTLQIELKTIPINAQGKPVESTHVCSVNLMDENVSAWSTSLVQKKLSHVLWMPIQYEKNLPLQSRLIGSPLLWKPTETQTNILRTDWEELMEMLITGDQERVSAHMGQVLQVRPKAANSHALTNAVGKTGETVQSLPRGFYLRAEFTASILRNNYHT